MTMLPHERFPDADERGARVPQPLRGREARDEPGVFADGMPAKVAARVAAVVEAYDFGCFMTLADIGGGRGQLLRAILEAVPHLDGILLDLPHVIEALDVGHERLVPRAGDFLVDPLPAADAYVLMEVLHDWDDAGCVAILRAIRRAVDDGATVLIVERLLSESEAGLQGASGAAVLASTGARRRSAGELGRLLEQAGFTAGTVVETAGPLHIVESTAV